MTSNFRRFVPAIGLMLCGCGIATPNIEDLNQKLPEYLTENNMAAEIKCELHLGVQKALDLEKQNDYRLEGKSVAWLNNWGAKVALNLTVDEKGTVAPGLSYSSPFGKAAQTVTAQFGASASSEATRKEQIQFTYTFKDLTDLGRLNEQTGCLDQGNVRIYSDLKIPEFIVNKAILASIPGTIDPAKDGTPYSTFSDEVTFVVAESASASPGFKLVRFSVNPSTPLLSAQRTKTNDFIVTLAKIDVPARDGKSAQLSPDGTNAFNAQVFGQQTGQAITNALRGFGLTPQ